MKTTIWLNKRYLAYAFGLLVDRFGNAIYLLALPLLMYHLTGSIVDMGLMAICQFFPRVICGFFIGSIVDRINRRTVIFAALIFQAICSGLLAGLYEFQLLHVWMIYVLGALVSVGFEFSRTAEIAIIPIMFKEQRVDATAGLAGLFTAMLMIGPIVAGILLSISSYELLLWLNTLTYFGPIVMCIWSRIPSEKNLGSITSIRSVTDAMLQGFVFFKNDMVLKNLLIVVLASGLAVGGMQTLLIFYMKHSLALSDSFISLSFACAGFGMLVGSVLTAKLKHWQRGKFLILSVSTSIIGLLLFLIPSVEMIMLAQFVLSIGTFSCLVAQDVIIQDVVPNEMMGRVGGFVRTLSHVMLSLSTALLVWLADILNAQSVFIFSTSLMLIAMLIVLRGPLMHFTQSLLAKDEG